MAFIIVPFDYNEKRDPSLVPICIPDTDSRGNRVHPAWVEFGLVPAAPHLRRIARRVLGDAWRASEIAEPSVHSLSRRNGADVGENPSYRVVKLAHWYAEDLRVGGRRARRKREVELFRSTLEALEDKSNFAADFEARETLDRLMDALERQGRHDVCQMVPMVLGGSTAQEFVERFQKRRNTLTQRFYRGMRRAAGKSRIFW